MTDLKPANILRREIPAHLFVKTGNIIKDALNDLAVKNLRNMENPEFAEQIADEETQIKNETVQQVESSLVSGGFPLDSIDVVYNRTDIKFLPTNTMYQWLGGYYRAYPEHYRTPWLYVQAPTGRGKTCAGTYMARRFIEERGVVPKYKKFSQVMDAFKNYSPKVVSEIVAGTSILMIDDFWKYEGGVMEKHQARVQDVFDMALARNVALWIFADCSLQKIMDSASAKYNEQIYGRICEMTKRRKFAAGFTELEIVNYRTTEETA